MEHRTFYPQSTQATDYETANVPYHAHAKRGRPETNLRRKPCQTLNARPRVSEASGSRAYGCWVCPWGCHPPQLKSHLGPNRWAVFPTSCFRHGDFDLSCASRLPQPCQEQYKNRPGHFADSTRRALSFRWCGCALASVKPPFQQCLHAAARNYVSRLIPFAHH